MRPIDFEVVHADLMTSKSILYSENKKIPFMLNMAGYHAGQAIEKLLKIILKEERYDVYKELSDSHNISNLVIKVELCRKGFIDAHPFIGENADELSKFNNLRYGKKYIERDAVFAVYRAANQFYKELMNEYLQEFPDFYQNRRLANDELILKGKLDIAIDKE